jgi:acetyl esterase
MSKRIFTVLFLILTTACLIFAQNETDVKKAESLKPTPDIADGKYGEFDRNIFDLWKPKSKKPTPLVVYIHGGGFNSGSKENLSVNLLNQLLKNGLAVMAINYRLLPNTHYPDNYMDCVRAIQFAGHNAKAWNIDKTKIAATGSSAGALTSLWIGFHDDFADPNNADPILRESSRLKAIAVFSAQTTLIPEVVRVRVGEAVMKHSFVKGVFFGITPGEANTPAGQKLFRDASPTTYLTKDDPPVWAMYSVPDKPLTADSTSSDAIHHPNFGKILKEEMDKLGIEIKLRHKDDGQNVNGDMVNFLAKYLK